MPIPIEVWYTDGYILSVNGMDADRQGGSVVLPNPGGQGGGIILTTLRQETGNTDREEQEIPPTLAYLSTTQSVSWLKEMYSVELGIINQGQPQFVLTDCLASLNLPQGLSLAELKQGQELTQEMPDIRGFADLDALTGKSSSDTKGLKEIFNSKKESPNYPEGFQARTNGMTSNKISNKELLEKLREIESGTWRKVYKDGFDSYGKKISIHYFQSQSGKVFNVKVKSGWSN